MIRFFNAALLLLMLVSLLGCPIDGVDPPDTLDAIVVNSLEDSSDPPSGTVTLRSALAAAADGQAIVFDASLDAGVINLTALGGDPTILKGEVMGMRDEPSGPVSYLVGYFERNYGNSALYAVKDVVIDASSLPSGITLKWNNPDVDARVLAVYGDLILRNVTVTGGRSVAVNIAASNPDQPWTLGRGGGVAVWGIAQLEDCTIYGNSCMGDFESSRDRGAFGGGLYANIVNMKRCVVSGNSILGGGAAGGGVYSVGGAGIPEDESHIDQSSITGNHISALFTYGGGVYSDGGGIGNSKLLKLTRCTIAQNLVDAPPMPPSLLGMGYWRAGGAYMSNGSMHIEACTIVENQVHGLPRFNELDKPNMAGGVAATIGNAHAVEDLTVAYSIICGNTVHELFGPVYEQDIFTGSLFYFNSYGYNCIGVIDFSQILVPVGEMGWMSLCRRHYPKQGDQLGMALADVLDLDHGVTLSPSILSAGVDAGSPAVLHYAPTGDALDQIPSSPYMLSRTYAQYADDGYYHNFLRIVLERIEDYYDLDDFADTFEAAFVSFLNTVDSNDEPGDGVQPYTDPWGTPILSLFESQWFGPAQTWPKQLYNYPYIEFWHQLDRALMAEGIPGMGPEVLGDDAWQGLFPESGTLDEDNYILMLIGTDDREIAPEYESDQRGTPRPANYINDIGAIEVP